MDKIKFLDKNQCDVLVKSITSEKYLVLVLLLMDCGLRVSEACGLKLKDFDFKKELVYVRSLKKRDNVESRKIPLSKRLYQALADYLGKRSNVNGDDWLFPSVIKHMDGPMTRFAVNHYLRRKKKELGFEFLNPHCLRHSFGTNHISNGTPLENIKTMLGHKKYDTTLIYAQIPEEILRKNIATVTDRKKSLLVRFLEFVGIKKVNDKRISVSFHQDAFSIGRQEEFQQLETNAKKGINTLLLGGIGTGKSHLLEHFKTEKKILKLDDLSGLKQSLIYLLVYLYGNDKEHCKTLIYGDLDLDKVKVKLNRASINNLAQEICKAVKPKEYILSIDSVDTITPRGVKVLEELKDYFVLFCGARALKIDRSSFAWNFDKLEVKPLKRSDAIQLIEKLSYDVSVEDRALFRNHIYEQSNGNPRVIFELVDRYRKEPLITNEVVRTIRHTASLKEIDMTFVIFVVFGGMYLLRYLSREVDNDAYRFLGGLALVLAMLFSKLVPKFRRKFF